MKVAFIVGHHLNAKGAYSDYLQKYEYDLFVNLLEDLIQNYSFDFFPVLFTHNENNSSYTGRQQEMANRVLDSGCNLAFEFHFDNFGDPTAEGCHGIYYGTNWTTKQMASTFTELMQADLGIKARSNTAVSNGDAASVNGAGFILEQYVDALLLECFFGSNPQDCDKFMGFAHDRFPKVLNELVKHSDFFV